MTSYSCPPPSVFVSNNLMELIREDPDNSGTHTQSPSFSAHLMTMDDLLTHVKNYIMKNNLYDPLNPLKILVDTELGSILGKSEFSLLDVRNILLEKCVFPVEEPNNSSEGICSVNEKLSVCVPKKRKKHEKLFFAKRFKGVDDDNTTSEESMHSFQGYETEFVKDSTPPLSDDNFSVKTKHGLIIAETFDVDVEYEIESSHTDNPSDFPSCESDSDIDIEDLLKNAIVTFIAHSSDSDLEYLADGSSSDDESENEISEKDKWCCSSCLTYNDPRRRCCEACWLTRVGWLSDDPRDDRDKKTEKRAYSRSKRKLKRLKKKERVNKDSSNYKLSDLPYSVAAESLTSSSSCTDKKTDIYQPSSNSLDTDKNHIQKTTELNNQELCLFCCSRPTDSSFIHGRLGCRISCFKCAKRLFNQQKRCPACRRTIERVVYLYNA